MTELLIPDPLLRLLDNSPLLAAVRAYVDCVRPVLTANILPFFPSYTDHGLAHISDVLQSAVGLIPVDVLDRSQPKVTPRLLNDADAALLICSILLHDLGMHIRPEGFLELVSPKSRFLPLAWFDQPQRNHTPDRPWQELWVDYCREARRFDGAYLTRLIGADAVRSGWRFTHLPELPGEWTVYHNLVVGEFIRRHHARLAHEIAIYGFPGLRSNGDGGFPALGQTDGHPLRRLADLIGLAARSHGLSLRVCKAYLESSPLYSGTPRPLDTVPLYSMALLRISDYLQIDRRRAPAILLNLSTPHSTTSAEEWRKHFAVESITAGNDSHSLMVTISPSVRLPIYLQLKDLCHGMQQELDHSAAVLAEAYGVRADIGLHHLTLAVHRIHSTLDSPAFQDGLPYVPQSTGFSSDPKLLALLVDPLYGSCPNVAVRELIQNAADAVQEAQHWLTSRNGTRNVPSPSGRRGDVEVAFIKLPEGDWTLRVSDCGIGMTAKIIQEYFLKAGASYRTGVEWMDSFADESGKSLVNRAGRFGVGAFAIFLLGDRFTVTTRHIGSQGNSGFRFEARADTQLIEIERVSVANWGTTIEVPLSSSAAQWLGLNASKVQTMTRRVGSFTDWYCWNWPEVSRCIHVDGKVLVLEQMDVATLAAGNTDPDWNRIIVDDYRYVDWTWWKWPMLICNGIVIDQLDDSSRSAGTSSIPWRGDFGLGVPSVSVCDPDANLPLSVQRFGLRSNELLPFQRELEEDVLRSYVAHALVCAPLDMASVASNAWHHPLCLCSRVTLEGGETYHPFRRSPFRWVATAAGCVPADPWLTSLLQAERFVVYGVLLADITGDSVPLRVSIPDMWRASRDETVAYVSFIDRTQVVVGFPSGVRDDDESQPSDAGPDEGSGRGEKQGGDRAPVSQNAAVAAALNDLFVNGVAALGRDVKDMHLCAKIRARVGLSATEVSGHLGDGWWCSTGAEERGEWVGRSANEASATIELRQGLEVVASDIVERLARERVEVEFPDVLFGAEFSCSTVKVQPTSDLARVWQKYLGATAIPFDSKERRALIERARVDPAFATHIDSWVRWIETRRMDERRKMREDAQCDDSPLLR